MSPKYLDSESIPADQIETEKRVARETAIAEGKPEKILDKIVEGRLKGFFKENTLLDQDSRRTPRSLLHRFCPRLAQPLPHSHVSAWAHKDSLQFYPPVLRVPGKGNRMRLGL